MDNGSETSRKGASRNAHAEFRRAIADYREAEDAEAKGKSSELVNTEPPQRSARADVPSQISDAEQQILDALEARRKTAKEAALVQARADIAAAKADREKAAQERAERAKPPVNIPTETTQRPGLASVDNPGGSVIFGALRALRDRR